MRKKAYSVLEYDKIIEKLKIHAGSDLTRAAISELSPLYDAEEIRKKLKETTEAVRLISSKGPLPLGGFYDIKGIVTFSRKGGVLTMAQLLKVLYNMRVAEQVKQFTQGEDVPDIPMTKSIVDLLAIHKKLSDNIDKCILSEDEMADNASPELRRIRRAIVRQNDSIKSRINSILHSNHSMLQDSIVTVRNGRYVIPVKQEYRNNVPGIIHDQSSTGATVFIEPQAIVNMNNELRQLEIDEKKEINRILEELSGGVSECYHDLINNQQLLLELDMFMAKGRFSLEIDGQEPDIDESGIMDLHGAAHPLIDKKKVVPINISIGRDYKTLIITGPNTGGKTVTLKTCGLLSLMAQTGLHIPVSPGSRIPVYKEVFADIGDEQSIEQSLSTFSSHMANIVRIIESAGGDSLVLLDELGAGTDPAEGAALAISELEYLAAKDCTIIATTHYTELKKYAIAADGVENASMEFDVDTLSPTYRLRIGLPGKSNAFEISDKLGLPENIISRASELLDRGEIEFEDVISSLEDEKKQIEEQQAESLIKSREIEAGLTELRERSKKLEQQQEKIIADAKEKAHDIIKEASDAADDFRKELKEIARLESLGERNKRFDAGRRRVREIEKKNRSVIKREKNDKPVRPDQIKAGDRVKILTLGQNGVVSELPDDKGNMQVQIGSMKFNVNISDIMLIQDGSKSRPKPKKKASGYGSLYKKKAQTVGLSIDVRGENLDDALMDVAKYLDDAYISGLPEVTIIHGRGEGILSRGIRNELKRMKNVSSYHRGGFDEGGDGVTVVKLK